MDQQAARHERPGRELSEVYVVHKHLSDMCKVSIRGQDGQTILHRTGCDPEIVGGNWSSNHPEAVQNDGIPLRCFLIHGHDMDPRRAQKLSECVSVLLRLAAIPKSGL